MSEVESIIIPSNPTDRKAINGVIKSIHESMTRVDSEKDYQKEAIKELEDKYNIKGKHFRNMANDFHKDQFDKKVAEKDAYAEFYEAVMEV